MIHILLLDDHAVVRTGYRRLIDAEADMRVVAEAATADEACAALRRQPVSSCSACIPAWFAPQWIGPAGSFQTCASIFRTGTARELLAFRLLWTTTPSAKKLWKGPATSRS